MDTFQKALRESDFVITAEIPLTPASTAADLRCQLTILGPCVHAVQFAEDRAADGRVSALAAASIAQGTGIDAILHLSCRDRNRLALQGDILGAALLGVSTLILHRGDKLPGELKGKVKGVFDASGIQLLEMARHLGEHADLAHESTLLLGSFVAAIRPKPDWQATKIVEKLDAGARILQTLPCLNTSLLREYVASLVAMRIPHKASIIVDVPLVTSPGSAEFLRTAYKGATIPARLVKKIAQSGDPRAAGISVCADALKTLMEIPGVAGANLVYVDGADAVAEVIATATGA